MISDPDQANCAAVFTAARKRGPVTTAGPALLTMGWTRTVGEIPAWELDADPGYYVEKWGPGSWAAYHGDTRIGEPGSYGTRGEAQAAAEAAHHADLTAAPTR